MDDEMEEVTQTSSTETEASSVCSSQSSLYSGLLSQQGGYPEDVEADSEIYFFESDHLALRGNVDYQAMLRALALLEAQRIQALADLDALHSAREAALDNPIQFVEKLQTGTQPSLPQPQTIASLPYIDWERYTSSLDLSSLVGHKHMTRLKRHLVDGANDDCDSQPDDGSYGADIDDSILVRGRIKSEAKPETFNKLWTVEEQKRLEELLLQNPPEEVEAKRWQKIATALGNRTPTQVASRVQKYFIKLAKAGLPIPGRQPNLQMYKNKPGTSYRQQRYHRHYQPASTFMQGYIPPVYMSDNEGDDSQDSWASSGFDPYMDDMAVSDDEAVPPELRGSVEYQELMYLKQVRHDKLRHQPHPPTEHVGFKCDRCEVEPIVGTRWHCVDCPPDMAVDFCDDCIDSSYETEQHNCSHRLKPKRHLEDTGFVDTDYMSFMPGGYNYLDPNYMPAS